MVDGELLRKRKEYVANYRPNFWRALGGMWWRLRRFLAFNPKTFPEWLGLIFFWVCFAGVVLAPTVIASLKAAPTFGASNAPAVVVLTGNVPFDKLLVAIRWERWVPAAVVAAMQFYMLSHKKNRFRPGIKRKKLEMSNQVKSTLGLVLGRIAEHTDCRDMTPDAVRSLIERLLQVIVAELCLIYKKFGHGDFYATLLVFKDGEHGQPQSVRIFARAVGDRPIDVEFPATDSIAYFAAKADRVFVERNINDDNHPFPKGGLSSRQASYSSILFIPVHNIADGQVTGVKAVLTIDCAEPYFFTDNLGNMIVTKVQPYRNLIATLLDSRPGLNFVRA